MSDLIDNYSASESDSDDKPMQSLKTTSQRDCDVFKNVEGSEQEQQVHPTVKRQCITSPSHSTDPIANQLVTLPQLSPSPMTNHPTPATTTTTTQPPNTTTIKKQPRMVLPTLNIGNNNNTLQNGRKRLYDHADGQWPLSIYLPIVPPVGVGLEKNETDSTHCMGDPPLLINSQQKATAQFLQQYAQHITMQMTQLQEDFRLAFPQAQDGNQLKIHRFNKNDNKDENNTNDSKMNGTSQLQSPIQLLNPTDVQLIPPQTIHLSLCKPQALHKEVKDTFITTFAQQLLNFYQKTISTTPKITQQQSSSSPSSPASISLHNNNPHRQLMGKIKWGVTKKSPTHFIYYLINDDHHHHHNFSQNHHISNVQNILFAAAATTATTTSQPSSNTPGNQNSNQNNNQNINHNNSFNDDTSNTNNANTIENNDQLLPTLLLNDTYTTLFHALLLTDVTQQQATSRMSTARFPPPCATYPFLQYYHFLLKLINTTLTATTTTSSTYYTNPIPHISYSWSVHQLTSIGQQELVRHQNKMKQKQQQQQDKQPLQQQSYQQQSSPKLANVLDSLQRQDPIKAYHIGLYNVPPLTIPQTTTTIQQLSTTQQKKRQDVEHCSQNNNHTTTSSNNNSLTFAFTQIHVKIGNILHEFPLL